MDRHQSHGIDSPGSKCYVRGLSGIHSATFWQHLLSALLERRKRFLFVGSFSEKCFSFKKLEILEKEETLSLRLLDIKLLAAFSRAVQSTEAVVQA